MIKKIVIIYIIILEYYPLIHNILGTVFTMNNGHDLNINMYWSNLQKMIERTHPTES